MSKNTGLVSVVMPTYNHAVYIKDAISSVLNQTYKNLELIIVDNFSEDNTEEIVKSFSDNDSRVKYVKFHNQGIIAYGRNKGIDAAKGEFLGFIDSDDIWKTDKLEKQIPLFKDLDIGIVCSRFETIESDGGLADDGLSRILMKGDVLDSLMTQELKILTSSVVVRKSIIDKHNFRQKDGRQGTEDWDFWLNVANVSKMDYAPEALVKRRYHGERISKDLEMMYKSGLTTIREFKDNILNIKDKHYKAAIDGEIYILNNFASWFVLNNRFDEAKKLIIESLNLKIFNPGAIKNIYRYIFKRYL